MHRRCEYQGASAGSNSCFLRGLVTPSAQSPIKKDWDVHTPISHQKGMKDDRYCSFGIGSPEPALASVHRGIALHNPTNFFTAQGLNNRASDITNLLDSIGNGVQVLQAANTGITSLQKLVDTAKSLANQVLQAPTGYSTKANVDVTGTGASTGTVTAANINTGKLAGAVITFKTSTGTLAVTIGATFATGSGTATVNSLDQ